MVDDIQQKLADAGIGTIQTNLFSTFMPSSPDSAVCVTDTGGPQPPGEIPNLKTPTFQVLIRNTNYDNGKAKLDAVRSALHGIKNTTLGNTFFYYILLVSEGGHIGRDEDGRDLFSLNFRCQIR